MKRFALLIALFIIGINANAQWTTNTALNTEVSSYAGINMDKQSISLTNGSTAIVFWKEVPAPTNYELWMQVISSTGTKLLGDTGTLISDSIPMSTYINMWSLTRDEFNNVYIGLNSSTGSHQTFVFKVDAQGNNLWGANGLNIGTGYVVRTLPMNNGNVAVTWQSGTAYTSYVQMYNSAGVALWANPVLTAATGITIPSELFEVTGGDIIAVYHLKGSYSINSTLYAQRITSTGTYAWTNPVQLSNKVTAYNSLYSPAQSNDTVYFGYIGKSNNRFDAFVQRINPDGTLPWGINGLDFDVNTTNFEMKVDIAIEENSSNLWAVCVYTNTNQTQIGEYVQKIDVVAGTRLLSNTAKNIFPIGSALAHKDKLHVYNDRPVFLLKKGMDNGVSETFLDIVILNQVGDFVWSDTSKAIASNTGTNKGQAQISEKVGTNMVITFVENKGSGNVAKIYAQNFVDTAILSSDAEILTYNLPTQTSSSIDANNDSIMVFMPIGTTYPINLAANYSLSANANAFVGNIVQDSSITQNVWNDSITPVLYNVIAEDGSINTWKVYVTATSILSSEADILTYSLVGQVSSTIITTNDSIVVYMPNNTNYPITLAADFTLSNNANATVGGIAQVTTVTTNTWNDSIAPVIYEVKAQDGITVKTWKIYVIAPSTVGINDVRNSNSNIEYSNPINDELYLNSDKIINEIKIIDITGRTIFNNENMNANNYRINTSNWKNGIYIIIINNKNSYKVIKN